MIRLRIYFAVAVCVLFVSSAARAQQTTFYRLDFIRGESASTCPERDDFVARLAARLGYSPFASGASHKMAIRFSRNDYGLHGALRVYDGEQLTGERELDSQDEDCSELTDALVLAAVIAIDPAAAFAAPREEAVAPAPVEAAPPAPSEPSEPWHLALGVGGYVDWQIAPNVSPAIGILGEARYKQFSLNFGVKYDFGSKQDVSITGAPSGGSFSASLVSAEIGACMHLSIAFGCAVASAGALFSEAYDLPGARSARFFWLGVGPRLGVSYDVIDWLALRAQFDVVFQPLENIVEVGSTRIWTTELIGLSGGIFVLARIP